MKCGGKGSQGSPGGECRRGVASMTSRTVEEILQGSNGRGHGFFETEAGAPGVGAKGGEEVSQWLCPSGARPMGWIRGPQVGDQLIAKVMDGDSFHGRASRQERPPVALPGGRC